MKCNDYTDLFPDVLGTLGLSVDTVLKKRGGPSGIDWEKDFESLDQHKATWCESGTIFSSQI